MAITHRTEITDVADRFGGLMVGMALAGARWGLREIPHEWLKVEGMTG